jgi:hypothetical protein
MSEDNSPEAVARISADLGSCRSQDSGQLRRRIGLNPAITKVAVDLLNLEPETAEQVLSESLEVSCGIRHRC